VTKIIVVTSGKGGVGKTTSSASFASGLALRGHKTAVIDFDVGLRNLDLIMGCERRVVYDMINVINREATLTQALIKDKHCDNLYVLPASQTRDKDALTEDGVERILDELRASGFEYIVCDSPAGIERGAVMALTFADEAIIVTNPEVSSVRDSDRILGIIQAKSRRAQTGDEPRIRAIPQSILTAAKYPRLTKMSLPASSVKSEPCDSRIMKSPEFCLVSLEASDHVTTLLLFQKRKKIFGDVCQGTPANHHRA